MTDTFRIFLASPGDVSFLREQTEKTVAEVNGTFKRHSCRFETFLWEYDVPPQRSQVVQQAIDAAAGETFDIFLGLLWHRFGTPVLEAGSGFEHEYTRAITTFQKSNPDLQVWMCRYGAPFPQDVNTRQLDALREFLSKHENEWVQLSATKGSIKSVAAFANALRKALLGFVIDKKGVNAAETKTAQSQLDEDHAALLRDASSAVLNVTFPE